MPMDSTIVAEPPGELHEQEYFPPLKEHDVLLSQVLTWMEELTRTGEDLLRLVMLGTKCHSIGRTACT
jgi:hypothetical protein